MGLWAVARTCILLPVSSLWGWTGGEDQEGKGVFVEYISNLKQLIQELLRGIVELVSTLCRVGWGYSCEGIHQYSRVTMLIQITIVSHNNPKCFWEDEGKKVKIVCLVQLLMEGEKLGSSFRIYILLSLDIPEIYIVSSSAYLMVSGDVGKWTTGRTGNVSIFRERRRLLPAVLRACWAELGNPPQKHFQHLWGLQLGWLNVWFSLNSDCHATRVELLMVTGANGRLKGW